MGTGNSLISVVVPVYKAEAYLPQCVDSLLAQSYGRLEIILVDDGSPDDCGRICDSYAARDNRVRVLHQVNQGVSVARNAGTAAATGEYVAFVDADDWTEADYIADLVWALTSTDAQIAVCAKGLGEGEILLRTGREALEDLLYQKRFDTAPWGKLFCAEIAKTVLFPEGVFFEDLAVVCRMFGTARQVVLLGWNGYHYRAAPEGTMNGGNVGRLLCQIDAADQMVKYIKETFPDLAGAAECRRFSAYFQVLMKLPREGYDSQKAQLRQYLRRTRAAVLKNSNARAKNRIGALASYFGEGVMQTLWKVGQ